MDEPKVIVPQRAWDTLKPKHLRFFVQYLKLGNATEAYMKVYRTKNRYISGCSASHIMAKHKEIKKLLYEANGLDEKAMIKVIKDALTANKFAVKRTGGIADLGPDHFIRLKAVEIRNKAIGEEDGSSGNRGNTLNVMIVKDKDKNIFTMGEEMEVIDG